MSEAEDSVVRLERLKESEVHFEVKEDEDGTSSLGEYIDSPETGDACDAEIEEAGEVSSQTSHEGKPFAAMEGELDFEDEDEVKAASQNESQKDDGKSENKDNENSGEEDGQCTPENKQIGDRKKDESPEEGEDDGEISDEDDLEEGEVKDNSPVPKQPARQVCRFFNRGQCTWGNLCRFLHCSGNEKGHYNMFAPNPRYSPCYMLPGNVPSNIMGPSNVGPMMNQRSGLRGGPDYMSGPPPLPPPPVEPTPVESAWERGLRQAKELVKKANKRKENEPDFEEKRLNLSIDVNERNLPDYDKENEFLDKSYKRQSEGHPYKYDESSDVFDNGEREAREHWRGGRYENFEIRWTRQDIHTDRRGDRERSRGRRMSSDREKISKHGRSKERWRNDRPFEVQSRSRADEWVDPWRRSKTPKGGRRTRSRSGSYSSVSSYSYSDRSSRSSCSYSRSSSRTSCASSRSRSILQKRKPSPATRVPSPKGTSRFTPIKKKQGRSSSSRSRSVSRTPSISRSRSRTYSRSLSMDSVSSASSSVTRSSSPSESLGNRNPHMSILRKQEEKPLLDKVDPKGGPSSLYEEMQRSRQFDQVIEPTSTLEMPDDDDIGGILPIPEQVSLDVRPFPSLQYLLPTCDKPKEPVKGLHKQPIKLTLLNKPAPTKLTSLPKKDFDMNRTKPSDEFSKTGMVHVGVKRSLSPPIPSISAKPSTSVMPRKSASSRRDELLKQLKAVEDAIARKRAKFC